MIKIYEKNISLLQGNTLKVNADITVVIDVIRAFTVSKVLFEKGIHKILLATDPENAFQLKQLRTRQKPLLAGEVRGLKISGFDLDNSPYTINKTDLSGCEELIQMTTNGTKAALNAKSSDIVLVTGMTNAIATAQFINSKLSEWNKENKPVITFLASHPESDEDVACAEFMMGLIKNPDEDPTPYINRILSSKVAEKFHDRENPDFLIEDLEFSARVEHSNYVMQVKFADDESFITKRMTNDIS